MIALPERLKRREANLRFEAIEDPLPASFPDQDILVVSDPRLFRPGFESFCQSLAESAVGQPGVRSVFICLASATCRLEFEPRRFHQSDMAECFADAVQAAIGQGQATEPESHHPAWISMMKFSGAEAGGFWETTREGHDSLRLRYQSPDHDRRVVRQVASDLATLPGIHSTRVTLWGSELKVAYNPERIDHVDVFSAADQAHRGLLQPVPNRPDEVPEVASGLQRLGYLTLASGSFGLTIVGLIVPGIPTVPFLLATSYYLVRSSPRLNRKLLRSKFFGPILIDLETAHGLRRINKIKLISFTIAIGLVTLLISGPSLPILIVMATVSSISIYTITRIPGITTRSDTALAIPATT